jgi:uncharacterized protein (DUF924 family)
MVDSLTGLEPAEVLEFWFGNRPEHPLANAERWFKRDEQFDAEIRSLLAKPPSDAMSDAAAGKLNHWCDQAESALALIILLDQFSRNLHRDSPLAFAQDDAALKLCLAGMKAGFDLQLAPIHRSFFYMPLMHSESLDHQRLCVEKFEALSRAAPPELSKTLENNHRFALEHMELIGRFGRFPHRNSVLGRVSTPEELNYLESPNAGF